MIRPVPCVQRQRARLQAIPIKDQAKMHPLELFDRFRRWFSWVMPGRQIWIRTPEQVKPNRSDDWLLEPACLDEARLLFPQMDEERALLRYQQLRLEMRERDDRGFS